MASRRSRNKRCVYLVRLSLAQGCWSSPRRARVSQGVEAPPAGTPDVPDEAAADDAQPDKPMSKSQMKKLQKLELCAFPCPLTHPPWQPGMSMLLTAWLHGCAQAEAAQG